MIRAMTDQDYTFGDPNNLLTDLNSSWRTTVWHATVHTQSMHTKVCVAVSRKSLGLRPHTWPTQGDICPACGVKRCTAWHHNQHVAKFTQHTLSVSAHARHLPQAKALTGEGLMGGSVPNPVQPGSAKLLGGSVPNPVQPGRTWLDFKLKTVSSFKALNLGGKQSGWQCQG
jgi:hypothetical protein